MGNTIKYFTEKRRDYYTTKLVSIAHDGYSAEISR